MMQQENSVVRTTPGDTRTPLLESFDHWVSHQPAAVAVEHATANWTYAQLDAASDALVQVLADHVAPGDLVVVALGRSPELVAAALAVRRLGATYLAVSDAKRLSTLADADIRPRAVLSRLGELAEPFTTVAVPAGDGVAVHLHDAAAGDPETAYVVLTSGSTGVPKPIAVAEPSLRNLCAWWHDINGTGAGNRVGFAVDVAFDPHLKVLWGALTTGAALCLAAAEDLEDPAQVLEWLVRSRITACVLPTPLGEMVISRPWPAETALRHLFIGGDRLREWPHETVTAVVHNAYGPAECTVMATSCDLGSADRSAAVTPPIGTAMPGADLCVVDGDRQVVPRGTAGELLIGGACLATGYLGRPELTADRFVTATVDGAGQRWYRTGDWVVMRPDGVLEYLGRNDNQVKVSGVRVELDGVEALAERVNGVRRAVVLALGNGADTRLAAFVLADDRTVSADAMRAHLAEFLHPAAVPGVIRFVDGLPHKENGKIDHEALRALLRDGTDGEEPGVTTEAELAVLRACRAVLGAQHVPLDVNFVDIGGSSLVAMRIAQHLERAMGVKVRARDLFLKPTLRDLAAALAG
ncbi:non-ribosomal peptide synthetase [Lentzea sp. JNUCC 0626]|uniref:non-ribosomal peptide synthetase n=1 Tax=Lentzea sp. JNUCC 0626 TaxID=3367513 RepID=UPI003748A797